ncbi:hypothetical protein D3C81_1183590 [compost metagenome]
MKLTVTRAKFMTKQRIGFLLNVCAQLILIHENEVCIRLLSKENYQSFGSELYKLIEQWLNNEVAGILVYSSCHTKTTEESIIFINYKN